PVEPRGVGFAGVAVARNRGQGLGERLRGDVVGRVAVTGAGVGVAPDLSVMAIEQISPRGPIERAQPLDEILRLLRSRSTSSPKFVRGLAITHCGESIGRITATSVRWLQDIGVLAAQRRLLRDCRPDSGGSETNCEY